MALFMKQDFSPPILSRKWIASKFRANMLIYSHRHIIDILESGLLFREDSIEVEGEAPCPEAAWRQAGASAGGWLTRGERNTAMVGAVACVLAAPPRNVNKYTLARLASLLLIPVAIRTIHRARCGGNLRKLLALMRDYMALARRATACCREYAALHAQLGSVTSAIESTHAMLYRQQKELLILMSRATSALLGNAPWIRGDITVEYDTDSLMKIHHAFLVVQSTLLKYIALAHYMPASTQKLYKNHNERIYWIHHTLIDNLALEFKDNYDALERMYRLLKNYGTKDNEVKKPGPAIKESWLYSDIHTGVARSCLELKLALNKCNDLDMFLDSCALNKQEIELHVLNKDIDDIIEGITKCLSTIQSSQIRLKKLQNKFKENDDFEKAEEQVGDAGILKIEAKEPEIKDEVFYFVKTEDDENTQSVADVVTAPGKKEEDTTKIVLNELKRKLVKREDLMRERERQALAKTMPELKNLPEFERQISLQEYVDRKGFLSKIQRKQRKRIKLSNSRKHKKCRNQYKLKICEYENESDIKDDFYEANAKLAVKSRFISVHKNRFGYVLNKWVKRVDCIKVINNNNNDNNSFDSSSLSDGLSDLESDSIKNVEKDEAINYKFSKKDLELTPSSSDSEFEIQNNALLNDIRRYRAVRKKNFPAKRPSIDKEVDESMKPIEYRFGTGMAMASVLQINNARIANMAEEVFIGNGEVSEDSGNDEDA